MSQIHSTNPTSGFLRLPQVLALIPVSKSSWWRGVKTGRYPKSYKLGPHTTVWRAEDIKAHIERVSAQNEREGDHE